MKEVGVALVIFTAISTAPLGVYAPHTAWAGPALSDQELRAALCQPHFQWNCEWVVARAKRESGGDPAAVNRDCDLSGTYRLQCWGLLQLESGWAPNGDVLALLDLWTNIEISHWVYVNEGKESWPGA